MKKLLFLALIALTIFGVAISYFENKPLAAVQDGDAVLMCNNAPIDKSKVVDFDGHRWYFTNGSMTNCEVVV